MISAPARLRRLDEARAIAFGLVAAALGLPSTPARAFADELRPSGSTSLGVLIGDGFGAGGTADIAFSPGALWWGVSMGIGFVSSDDAQRSRVFLPVAAAAGAIAHVGGPLSLDLRVRLGGYGGAIDAGIHGGGYGAVGAHLRFAIDPVVALHAGCEAIALLSPGTHVYAAPMVGLAWRLDD